MDINITSWSCWMKIHWSFVICVINDTTHIKFCSWFLNNSYNLIYTFNLDTFWNWLNIWQVYFCHTINDQMMICGWIVLLTLVSTNIKITIAADFLWIKASLSPPINLKCSLLSFFISQQFLLSLYLLSPCFKSSISCAFPKCCICWDFHIRHVFLPYRTELRISNIFLFSNYHITLVGVI